MGRGTGSRHSKNAGIMGSEALTYNEKRILGYGTIKERMGKETVKAFDDCALCLHPVQDPVCTPEGVLYEKEVILECLLAQKKDNAKKLALWEAQEQEDRAAEARAAAEAEERRLSEFHQLNHGAGKWQSAGGEGAAGAAGAGGASGASNVQVTAFEAQQLGTMKAFWLPSKTPEAKAKLEKPDMDTKCPATGKKLRMKDLIPVKFTKVPAGQEEKGRRFMCPMCKETFGPISKIIVLRPTGDAISEECYRKLVAPDGVYNGVKVRPKDAVRLERGGTGFAATQLVESSTYDALGLGNGLAQVRGQNPGPTSKFALKY